MGDGLRGAVLDLARIQGMLQSEPRGKTAFGPWVHRLFSYLMCDHNSVITTDLVLQQIRKCAETVKPDKEGWRTMCLYFTGHGDTEGNWCFPDGTITLQDVVDQIPIFDKFFSLRIFTDCCYSGNWCNLVKERKVYAKGKVYVTCYAACAHDE